MRRSAWQREGHEPDYRFSLANERTFLAWIRTALALMAGAVLLHQFAEHLRPDALSATMGIPLALIACVVAAVAYFRWKANEIAMRHGQPLASGYAIPLLAACLCGVGLILAFLILVS